MGDQSLFQLVEVACDALMEPRHTLAGAPSVVPDRPGLYAIHADGGSWRQLGLGDPPDTRPLYVGKAEDSLVTRDLNTHFRVGRTGQSTLRRTFAALLRSELNLRGIPRNQQAPERPSHFAVSEEHDQLLNSWMNEHLRIAVWTKSSTTSLGAIEIAVLAKWNPPLNIRDNKSAWRTKVSAARKAMADDARAWAAARGLTIKKG